MSVRVFLSSERVCGEEVSFFEKVVNETFERAFGEEIVCDIEVSIGSATPSKMKILNCNHRGIDAPTDVLSFAHFSSHEVKNRILGARRGGCGVVSVGDVIVCPSILRKSAKLCGDSYQCSVCEMVSHGVLHLLGFSHSKKMFSIQDAVRQAIGCRVISQNRLLK